jgi:hypothetical protein
LTKNSIVSNEKLNGLDETRNGLDEKLNGLDG